MQILFDKLPHEAAVKLATQTAAVWEIQIEIQIQIGNTKTQISAALPL